MLDGAWLLDRASAVLARRVHLWPDHTVYEAAARLAGALPAEAMAVTRAMIETDEEGWSVHGAADAVRDGIMTALATENGGVEAGAVIELLTARGLPGYHELLG
jgi:LDH2 family malate/lactate/ureidoglycolate dehydrogenase